ncbi:PREDICTED: monocarboxylate transporter 13-like [Priapulus caudatus]|uniref:Monocarboxylate transporter 13-like n=1 Tax=Priapulus caudatus TaxID=37621 RepID=A0ABM1F161_PRICU|nr:PREDICTED: monocarboxylate transporter 13-like [Priapulus caudatus]
MATRCLQTDRGWAWLVLFAAVINQIVGVGFSIVLNAYYVPWLQYFGEGRFMTAWISSVNIGIMFFVGPLATALTSRFGVQRSLIASSLLSGSCYVISSYAQNITTLIVLCGAVSGAGVGVGYMAGYGIIGEYFEKWRGLAYGIAATGVGIAPMILAPLQQYLIDSYTWRGALIISAGVVLNGCVVGAIMRDPPVHHTHLPAHEQRPPCWDSRLIKDAPFLLLCVSNTLCGLGLSPGVVLFYDHLENQGLTQDAASWAFMIWGILNVCGRLAAAFIIQTQLLQFSGVHVYYVSQTLTGIFSALLGIPGQSYLYYNTMAGFYACCYGMLMAAWPMTCVEMFGQNRLMTAMGWFQESAGVGYIVGAPLGGYIADAFGSTALAYYGGGLCLAVGGLVVVPLPYLRSHGVKVEAAPNHLANDYSKIAPGTVRGMLSSDAAMPEV